MATDKQIAANIANAKLSTGPKTAAGRSRSSRNSLKHGIRAQKIALLAGEEAWVDIAEEYLAHFRPAGPFQHGLVMEMLQSLIALDRCHRVEGSLLTSGRPGENLLAFQFACPMEADDNAAHEKLTTSSLGEGTSTDIATPATNAKALATEDAAPPAAGSLLEVMKINDTERAELKILSDNFAQNSQMLELLRKYRTSRENSFYRALHELQRDQGLECAEDSRTEPPFSTNGNSTRPGFDSDLADHDGQKSADGK